MSKSFVNIDGVTRNSAELTFPPTGKEFREAWQFNGDVIEIDMPTARSIKIEKIVRKANERVEKAERKALEKAFKGEDTTAEDDEVSKFKSKPKQAGIDLIANATTPEELDALDEDTLFA